MYHAFSAQVRSVQRCVSVCVCACASVSNVSCTAPRLVQVKRAVAERPGDAIVVFDEYGVNRSGYLIVR